MHLYTCQKKAEQANYGVVHFDFVTYMGALKCKWHDPKLGIIHIGKENTVLKAETLHKLFPLAFCENYHVV